MDEELLYLDQQQQKWFLELESTSSEYAVKIVEMKKKKKKIDNITYVC